MPQPMKPTGRLVVPVVVLGLALAACTRDDEGNGDGASGASGGTGEPSPTISVAPGVYLYANAGLVVTLDLDALTMEVDNGTGRALPKPDFYVLHATDGAQVDGRVVDATGVPGGETATFAVELSGIALDDIGLAVLLMGKDNYGAFVRQ